MFQICFLTFSIYIGSSIYTAGLVDVEETFHVSTVAATLGLTMFGMFMRVSQRSCMFLTFFQLRDTELDP